MTLSIVAEARGQSRWFALWGLFGFAGLLAGLLIMLAVPTGPNPGAPRTVEGTRQQFASGVDRVGQTAVQVLAMRAPDRHRCRTAKQRDTHQRQAKEGRRRCPGFSLY